MLVRAAGTGNWSHTASIKASTDTGRFRLRTSMANTARCFGAPNGTRVPPAVSCNGPRTPNSRPAFPIRAVTFRCRWALAHHCDRNRLTRHTRLAKIVRVTAGCNGLCLGKSSDDSARVTGRQDVCWYVTDYDAARPDNRVGANSYSRTYDDSGQTFAPITSGDADSPPARRASWSSTG